MECIGHIETQIWAISSMIGNIVHTLKLHISTAHWDGTQATGDLAFMLVILAATIITSDDHRSTTFTTELIAGEWMAEEVGITEEKSSTAEIITADMVWEIATYVAITIEEETTIITMVLLIKTTAHAASAISNAETLMDHVTTSTTLHERVQHEQRLLNLTVVVTSVEVGTMVAQQEAMSQVAHSMHQATASVVVAQHLAEAAQVVEAFQTEVAHLVDIDNDIKI